MEGVLTIHKEEWVCSPRLERAFERVVNEVGFAKFIKDTRNRASHGLLFF